MGINTIETTENIDPNLSYALTRKAAIENIVQNASWVQQDLPADFNIFMKLVKQRFPFGLHLDVGTDNGEKAIKMLLAGLNPMVAFDIDLLDVALPVARNLARNSGVEDKITFIKADGRIEIPVEDNSVVSATSICVAGTHFTNEERTSFVENLFRKVVEGGLVKSRDFSGSDTEFYGEEICNQDGSPRYREYRYSPNLSHPHANPKYRGMFNQHHIESQMEWLYGPGFRLVSLIHVIHPNSVKDPQHAGRFLWDSIYERVSEEQKEINAKLIG